MHNIGMKNTKDTAQKYIYSQKAALDFLKQRIDKLAPNINSAGIIENSSKFLFKNFHQKSSQQIALDKFSEIKNVVRQISDDKK